MKVIRLQNPLPNATLTDSGDAPAAIAANATTSTAIDTNTKASGNQRSAQPVNETDVNATVVPGYLEQSTVDAPSLMVDMIRLNRLFEMSMKVASTLSNDLDASSINNIANLR